MHVVFPLYKSAYFTKPYQTNPTDVRTCYSVANDLGAIPILPSSVVYEPVIPCQPALEHWYETGRPNLPFLSMLFPSQQRALIRVGQLHLLDYYGTTASIHRNPTRCSSLHIHGDQGTHAKRETHKSSLQVNLVNIKGNYARRSPKSLR